MRSAGQANPEAGINWLILSVGVLSVTYNCILAFINHNIMPLSTAAVVMSEGLLMGVSLLFILRKGIYEEDLPVLAYLLLTLVITAYMIVVNRAPFIDYLRNVLIIFCFALLGKWANRQTMMLAFRISCAVVLIVLTIEMISVPAYVALFHPAEYFQNTRGLAPPTYDNSGLFGNALGFQGRFSFGIISHRSSSIFLEQVSLANFCGVMVMYAICFWDHLKMPERALFILTIVLILVTNNTRTMLIFSIVSLIGYFIYPLIPKIFDFFLMPLIIVVGFIVHAMKPDATGDNFVGRIVFTVNKMLGIDLSAILGLSIIHVPEFADSGYVYIIYASTIFGLLFFWLFVAFFPAGRTPNQRRFAHALSLFMFLNLMIGSTAVFSMKTAGLIWLLAGYMKAAEGGSMFPGAPRVQANVQRTL